MKIKRSQNKGGDRRYTIRLYESSSSSLETHESPKNKTKFDQRIASKIPMGTFQHSNSKRCSSKIKKREKKSSK